MKKMKVATATINFKLTTDLKTKRDIQDFSEKSGFSLAEFFLSKIKEEIELKKKTEELDIKRVKMTPKMIRDSKKLREQYKDKKNRHKYFSPMFTNSDDYLEYMKTL